MKWLLVHRDASLGRAWRQRFGRAKDVQVVEGDICRIDCDAIVSPANSFGFMDGGLDHHLSVRFGWDLQARLQETIARLPTRELLVGDALIVPTGDAAVPWLVSAPTMRVPMLLRESVNAYLAMKAVLARVLAHAEEPEIRTVAIPGLGTGVGGLDPGIAAGQMWTAYEEIVLGGVRYPLDFGEARSRHLDLSRGEIDLRDP